MNALDQRKEVFRTDLELTLRMLSPLGKKCFVIFIVTCTTTVSAIGFYNADNNHIYLVARPFTYERN